jgi:hypothetical protein
MHAASNSARRTGSATADDALTVARRRAERFDMLVASVLLLALIFGWVVRVAPPEPRPRGDFFMASTTRHA